MTEPISADDLRLPKSRTLRFEGADHGSEISFFLVDNEPGQGPELHRHPYTETWTVLEGAATFRLGDAVVEATGGDTLVSPPNTWHGFRCTGAPRTRVMGVHASPRIIQEDYADPGPDRRPDRGA